MLQLNPNEFLLNDIETIAVLPDEDLVLVLDFKQDMTGAAHKIIVEEHKWPYAPSNCYVFPRQERTTFDSSDEVNGIIKHTFSVAEINLMRDRRLDIRWQVVKDGRTWIAADREFYVGNRD